MKKILAPLILCIFTTCASPHREQHALEKPFKITLSHAGSDTVHSLDLKLKGQGTGEFILWESGKVYRRWVVQGAFQHSYRGDWYAVQAQLQWHPRPGHFQGQLEIHWHFYD